MEAETDPDAKTRPSLTMTTKRFNKNHGKLNQISTILKEYPGA